MKRQKIKTELLPDLALAPKKCRFRRCQQVFLPNRAHQKYCNDLHRTQENNLKLRDFIRKGRAELAREQKTAAE